MRAKTNIFWIVGTWLLMLLAACGGSGSSGTNPAAPSAFSYQAPAAIDVSTAVHWIPMVTGTVTGYTVSPALPSGLILDASTGIISGAATSVTASAPYVVTASNAGGSTTYKLVFAVQVPAIGPTGEVKLGGTTELPVIALSSATPTSGQAVTVNVAAAGATRIVLTVAGSGCGALAAATANTSKLTQTGDVATSGQCQLTATVTSSTGTAAYTAEFTIAHSTPLAAQGLSVTNGTYFPSGDLSLLSNSSAVSVHTVQVPQSLINGGSASVYLTQNGSAVATRAILQFSGVPGYYVVPLTLDTATGTYRVDLQASANFVSQLPTAASSMAHVQAATRRSDLAVQNLPATLEAKSNAMRHAADVRVAAANATSLTVTVSLIGPDGGLSAPATTSLPVQGVGSGPIQVSLSWVGAVDVDLHVTPPSGSDIYYGNTNDTTGGVLDLDSNASCSIDNVNNENIVWSNTTHPTVGSYQVRVDYWSNCSNIAAIPYTLRVTNCGTSQTYTGTLSAGQADHGRAGSGILVATIDYHACSGLSVTGTARYDDYEPTASGLSTTARQLPIRYAQVEVHQSSDDTVLATGQTDENGGYSLTFSMATPGKYYVKVLASQSLGWLSEKVVNTSGAIYAIKTPDQDASITQNATGIDLSAKRNASFAEAFNIFDVGVVASKEVQARLGIALPELTWRWTAGQATCGGSASCYQKSDNSIYVLSTAADTDEYDDTVLAHEFGHFVMRQVSRDESPGGTHGLDQQNIATLAWSEGVATFIGQRMMQTPTYIDTNASTAGAFLYNIETLPSYVPAGTSDGTLSGNLSEALVTAVLWDLADTAQDSKTVGGTLYADKIANPDAVYSILKSWKGKSHDRATTGADLVDFIDEWLCTITTTTWEATPGDNFSGLISKLNGFPYTPPATASCQ